MKTIDDIKCAIQHIRGPIDSKSKDWHQTADQWLATFKTDNGFFTVDYFTGIGHRITKKDGWGGVTSKPKTPSVKDVVYSLYSGAMGAQENFKYWCDSYGYSDDSIEALNIYKACIEQGVKLRKLDLSGEYLDELFENY